MGAAAHLGSCVVVGAGQAGSWIARTLRSEGFEGPLLLIGEEPHPPYERPPLSKAILCGAAGPASATLLGADEAAALGISLRLSTRVERIDRNRRLVLCDGEAAPYGHLFLATGGRARLVPGVEPSGRVHVLRTLDDALRLRAALGHARSLLVLGGGWIGLEVAAAARGLGLEVSVVERDERLCRRSLPPAASAFLRDLHTRHGVVIRLGESVGGVHEEPGGAAVRLSSGAALRADLVLACVGMAPDTGLAEQAGLAVADGVLVDGSGRTSDPAISAAGDVARHPNSLAGGPVRLESWANAQDQGIAAARGALGLPGTYDPVPWFWSDQFGANIQVCGFPERGAAASTRGTLPGPVCWMLLDPAGRMVGGVGVNAAREVRHLRKALAQGCGSAARDWEDAKVPLAGLPSHAPGVG